MRSLTVVLALLCLASDPAGAAETHGSIGSGGGIALPRQDPPPCEGTLVINYDGEADCNGYCWQYGGIMPPYYGAFAECYDFSGTACGIELQLSALGYPCFGCNLYVWADAGGVPGNVLSVTPDADPCPVAIWPNVSTHDFPIDPVEVDGPFWVGYWTDASDDVCPYFITASCNGVGSCPYTNIAPGMGYPTGWQSVDIVWGPTRSIGIGVWRLDEGTPTGESSWSRVKTQFR